MKLGQLQGVLNNSLMASDLEAMCRHDTHSQGLKLGETFSCISHLEMTFE